MKYIISSLILCANVFLFSSCYADIDINMILQEVKERKLELNNKSNNLEMGAEKAYVDEYVGQIKNLGFEDTSINVINHIKSRLDKLDCSSLVANDEVTLHMLFQHFDYFDHKCASEFSFDENQDFLLFYVLSSNVIEKLINDYELTSGPLSSLAEAFLYDMAFIYCDKELMTYLESRGVLAGQRFNHEQYLAREKVDLYSCI